MNSLKTPPHPSPKGRVRDTRKPCEQRKSSPMGEDLGGVFKAIS